MHIVTISLPMQLMVRYFYRTIPNQPLCETSNIFKKAYLLYYSCNSFHLGAIALGSFSRRRAQSSSFAKQGLAFIFELVGRCFASFANLVLAVPRPSATSERVNEQRFTQQFYCLFCRRFAFWDGTFGIFYTGQSRCAFLYAYWVVGACFFLAYLPSRMFTWFCNWNDLYFWWCSPNSYWNYFSTHLQRSVFSTSTYGTLCFLQNCHPTS